MLGGAITTASALVLIGFWVVAFFGHGASSNPYLGIIFDLILPGIFVAGLILILIGILVRRRYLVASDQVPSFFPEISMNDPIFRCGIDFVAVATCFNFIIVGTASYRGVAYMDTSSFCGASCQNDKGMQRLIGSGFELGADASAAAGPVGRHASAVRTGSWIRRS